jgi:hypothetical protein
MDGKAGQDGGWIPFPFLFIEPDPEPPLQTGSFDPMKIVTRISGRMKPGGKRDKILVLHSVGFRDIQAEEIVAELASRGEPVFYFDTPTFLNTCRLSIELGQPGIPSGLLEMPSGDLALDEIKSVWFRGPGIEAGETASPAGDAAGFIHRETEAALFGLLGVLDRPFWMNHPNAVQAAQDKLAQLRQAESLGLIIPRTLVTNDPQKLLGFYEMCNGKVILKTFTRLAYRKDGRENLILTNRVLPDHLEKADLVQAAPCLFQEYVAKDVEIRVTMVGRRLFAAEIHSQDSPVSKDDYRRYDLPHTRYQPHSLPPNLEIACLRLMEVYGLTFGAIDLIRRPEGEYVFLEINANAQYLWVQDLTGLPIRESVVDTLIQGSV